MAKTVKHKPKRNKLSKRRLQRKKQYQLYIFNLIGQEYELNEKLYRFIVPEKFIKL